MTSGSSIPSAFLKMVSNELRSKINKAWVEASHYMHIIISNGFNNYLCLMAGVVVSAVIRQAIEERVLWLHAMQIIFFLFLLSLNTPPPLAISGTTLTLTPTQLILAPSGATLKFCSRQMYSTHHNSYLYMKPTSTHRLSCTRQWHWMTYTMEEWNIWQSGHSIYPPGTIRVFFFWKFIK
jgi:acid stress-induced BolA-like protein IbaG/YrbA